MSDKEYIPNTFQTPNAIIDRLMPLLTDSEFRVLIYMVRHILGWEKQIATRRAHISLSRFEGRVGHGNGCGLGRGAIIEALESLEQFQIVQRVGKAGNKGQMWELRLVTKGDPDIEKLEARHDEKLAKCYAQTDKARQMMAAKRSVEQTTKNDEGGLSDNTSTGNVEQTSERSVEQTESNPSNPFSKTHENPSNKDSLPKNSILPLERPPGFSLNDENQEPEKVLSFQERFQSNVDLSKVIAKQTRRAYYLAGQNREHAKRRTNS